MLKLNCYVEHFGITREISSVRPINSGSADKAFIEK